MKREVISDRQGISLIIIFIIGSSSVFVYGVEAEQDLWLAIVLALLMALPVAFIYAKLHTMFPNKDLFDICEICFGKFIGKIFILLFSYYVFDVTALNLRNYGQFIETVSLVDTPMVITMLMYTIICIAALKDGLEVLGRWSEVFIIIPVFLIVAVLLLSIPNMKIQNLQPVLANDYKLIIKGAYEIFSYPFAYIVAYTMVFSNFKSKNSPYKIYVLGLLGGGAIVFLTYVMGFLVIGPNYAASLYYPNYAAISRIQVGELLQRIEIISGLIFMLGGFIEISIYLLATCKGVSKLSGIQDYRLIVTPLALLALNLAYFEFNSVTEYFEWSYETWTHYSLFFQVILPVNIFISAKFKSKQGCKQSL